MSEVDPVILRLLADVNTYNQRVAQAEKLSTQRLANIEKAGDRMGQKITASFKYASTSVIAFAATFATLDLARRFLAITDEAKSLDASLRLATAGFGSFNQAQADVRRIAEVTRSGLSETADLYGNFSRGAKELGATQAEAARATETFSKTLRISGADANQAASATLQFGQALAAGALRGDELNSILEASPRLARLLAESMGMPIGQIKKLGEEGKLTSDKLLRALTDKKFTEGIDDEFNQLPVTFDQAMTQVENAAIITFGAFDRGGRFSEAIAHFIVQGVDGFADMEKAAEQFGINARAEIEGLASAFAPVIAAAQRLFGMIDMSDLSFEQDTKDIDRFTGWLSQQGLGGRLLTGNSAGDWWNGKPAKGTNFHGRYVASKASAQRLGQSIAGERAMSDSLQGFDVMGRPIKQSPVARPAAAGSTGSSSKKTGTSAETLAKRAEQERVKAIRDEAAKQRDIARYNDDVLAARSALATATADILSLELQAIENERSRQLADIETDRKLGELNDMEAAERRGLVNETANLRKQRAHRVSDEAKAQQEIASIRDEADTLDAEARLADTLEQRHEIERRILELRQKEESAALEAAIAAGQIADAAQARANMERRHAAQNGSLERDQEGPIDRYARGLRKSPEELRRETEGLVVEQLQYVQDGISDAISNRLGVKDPLLKGLIDLFIEQVIMRPIADAFSQAGSGGSGGLGGILGGLGTILFGRASGGYVGPGQMVRVNEGASPGNVEGFMSRTGGHIIPLGRMNASSARPTVVQRIIQVDARGAVMNDQFASMILAQSKAYAADAGAQAYRQSMRDAPAAVGKRQRYGV